MSRPDYGNTAVLRFFRGLSGPLILFAVLCFGGCKSAQPTGPISTPQALLRIDSVAPLSGIPGTLFKIYGSGFGTDTSKASVTFGQNGNSIIQSLNYNTIVAEVPHIPGGKYPIIVKIDTNSTQSKQNFAVLKDSFLFSSIIVEFHNIFYKVDSSVIDSDGISGFNYDTTYNERFTDTLKFQPELSGINTVQNLTMNIYDSTYTFNQDPSVMPYDYLTTHFLDSAVYRIDTLSKVLSTFTFFSLYSTYHDQGNHNGLHSESDYIVLTVKNVPFIYSGNRDIVATIPSTAFSTELDSLTRDISEMNNGRPCCLVSTNFLLSALRTQSSDAYVKITFKQ